METGAITNVIQRLCLPQSSYFPGELFFRGKGLVQDTTGPGGAPRRSLLVSGGETLSFDTYFNLFPVFKWIRYTRMSDLSLYVALKGAAEVSLLGFPAGAPDQETVLKTIRIQSEDLSYFKIYESSDLSGLPDFLYVSVRAQEETVLTDLLTATGAQRDPALRLACCFCTYRREEDIRQDVTNLLTGIVHNGESPIRERLHIYISDNGRTLPPDLYENEKAVHLFYNKNYGGSAGFTRCMIEACFREKNVKFSHLILMDDDALILPEVVERTAALIGIAKEEYKGYMVGGALLSRETPCMQKENGVFLDIARNKRTYIGRDVNLLPRAQVAANETSKESSVNYNGWWYTCIPTSLVTEDNLPLPLFLHLDDQEYGLRNGGKFLRLNGICAWHPSVSRPARKKSYMSYYDCRNRLIVQAGYYPEMTALTALKGLLSLEVSSILNYMYQNCEHAGRGVLDFYRGVDAFKTSDPEAQVQAMIKDRPFASCRLSAGEREKVVVTEQQTSSGKRNLRRLLNWLLPAHKGKAFYSEELSPGSVDLFGVKELYLVNPATGEGHCYRKSYKEAFRCLPGLVKSSFVIVTRHKKVYKEWQEHLPELQSYRFWKEYLGI